MNFQEILAEILEHLRGMWRFRWAALGVSWIVALVAWAAIYKMPDVYKATARVLVDTNSLLPDLTEGLTAGKNIMNEVEIVYRALLTRPNVEEVARQTDLDLRADSPQQFELLVTQLLQRIDVESGQGGTGKLFIISYKDEDRRMARDVVAALIDTFVETSLGRSGSDADISERALTLEIENHEQRLLEAETELADFKKHNIGYMPDDGADYYTQLQTALTSVQDLESKIRLLRLRRDEIQRQLDSENPQLLSGSASTAQVVASCSKATQIADLQGQLSTLQVDFTDKHPRIVMLRDTIANLEAQCTEEVANFGGFRSQATPNGTTAETNLLYQNLRIQLSDTDVELATLQEMLSESRTEVRRLRDDVDKIAEVELSLKRLNRDYAVVETRHQELLRRWETLQSKKRLDPMVDHVQFRVVEPPFASAVPIEPNRPILLAAAVILAIGAGVALAFGLNQLKPVVFTRRSIASAIGLPVLGSISMILSQQQAAWRRRGVYVWACGNVMLLVAGGVVVLFERQISAVAQNVFQGMGL